MNVGAARASVFLYTLIHIGTGSSEAIYLDYPERNYDASGDYDYSQGSNEQAKDETSSETNPAKQLGMLLHQMNQTTRQVEIDQSKRFNMIEKILLDLIHKYPLKPSSVALQEWNATLIQKIASMKDNIDAQKMQISEQKMQISEQKMQIGEQKKQIGEQKKQIGEQKKQIGELQALNRANDDCYNYNTLNLPIRATASVLHHRPSAIADKNNCRRQSQWKGPGPYRFAGPFTRMANIFEVRRKSRCGTEAPGYIVDPRSHDIAVGEIKRDVKVCFYWTSACWGAVISP